MDLTGKRVGNYRVGPELGRGGMGAVYRAATLADGPIGPAGTEVALKVFHPHLVQDEAAFQRFRREAEVGKLVRHEHVVRTHDIDSAEVDGEPVHYMVMEVIEGQTLESLLSELGTVPDHLLFQIADQVLAALEAIHERGIIHRDIKPQNIVITPDHRVLVMDLGVARLHRDGETLTRAGEFVGSVVYAAPEQFQSEERIGPRVDLYAFGVVLFELATGSNPYGAADLATILQQKFTGEVPAPRNARPDLDVFLNEVIVAATRSQPSARFASAAELRQVLREGEAGEWWRQRAAGVAVPPAERALRRLRVEREASLAGRAEELTRLRDLRARAREHGGALLLRGPSGAGKSRLVYEFLEETASSGGPAIAAGRAVGSGGRSYQPVVEALADLLDPQQGDPARRRTRVEERLRELLRDTPGAVPHMLEFVLGGVLPAMETGFSDDALRAACARIVERVAAERPLILVFEDLHLAGAETLELFRYLARCVPGTRTMLVGVVADDDVEEGSALQEFLAHAGEAGVESLPVPPLPFAATEQIVRAVVHDERTVRALSRPLHDRADGNPAIVLDMVAHLREGGAFDAEAGGIALDETVVPRTVRDLVGLKLARLDDEQRETLEIAAILGYQFDAGLIAEVLGEQSIQLLKRLAALERKHRLLASSGKSAFRFANHHLFDAVYGSITPALRIEYHAVVADTLLGRVAEACPDPPTAYALLSHLLHAERAVEAEPYLDPALDYVEGSIHAANAAPFLERVLEALAGAPAARRFAVAMKLWGCYELLARRPDQLRVLETARDTAGEMGEAGPRARAHACTAHTCTFTGEFDRATTEAQAALALAREAGDRKWESNVLHLQGLIEYRRGKLAEAAARWREALAIRRDIGDRRGEASSLQALGAVMPVIGEAEHALETKLQALAICREIGDRRGEGALLNNVANSLCDEARYEESLERFEEAIRISRELGAVTSEAHQLCNMGLAYGTLGRVAKAKDSFERALGLFRAMENPSGELATLTLLGPILAEFGDYGPARERLEEALALGRRLGARPKLAVIERALGTLAHRTGARAEAWEHFERALALEDELKSPASRTLTLLGMAEAALREEDHARAETLLAEAIALPGGASGAYRVVAFCRLARARRGLGKEEEAAAAVAEARNLLAQLRAVPPDIEPEITQILPNR